MSEDKKKTDDPGDEHGASSQPRPRLAQRGRQTTDEKSGDVVVEKKDPVKSVTADNGADKKKDSEGKKTEEKFGDVVINKKKGEEAREDNEELNLEENVKEKKTIQIDEDLPEEIKKKLEKNKAEKTKKKQVKRKKKKVARTVKVGKAYIKATYNNTIITLTDAQGDVISWASAGVAGFRGPKKATPYAAQIIVKIACLKAKEEFGLEEVAVFVKGVGTGRESAIRALNINGLNVTAIKDITPIPHNGCRARKPRRV